MNTRIRTTMTGAPIERKATENFAQIDTISRAFGDGKATRAVTMTIYPDAAGEVWDYYLGPKA